MNPHDMALITRLFMRHLLSNEGKDGMIKVLRATRSPADAMQQYYPRGHFGDVARKLDVKKLEEYHGWIYGGTFYSSEAIEIEEETELAQCEDCGGQFPIDYCLQDVKVYTGGRDPLKTLCTNCRRRNEDVRIKDTASFETCKACPKEGCQWHPRRDMRAAPEQPLNVVKQLEHKPATGQGWDQSRYAAR
jgi:hypothetical protein